MDNFYNIDILDDSFIDMSTSSSRTLCYRMTYKDLKSNKYDNKIDNPFVVYILHAKNYSGKDHLYIGKSKNGIFARPKQHENKNIEWDMCYVLTQFKERTILNDGTIQYLEDIITEKANETNCYHVVTQQTSKGTANRTDVRNCQAFVEDALEMLYILGLDLKTIKDIKDTQVKNTLIDNIITDNIINTNKHYWVYAAGEQSIHWDDFYNLGIMGLGWNEVDNLSKYNSKEEIKDALINNRNSNNSFSQASLMLWQFANVMKPGDIIFVRRGVQEIVGKGEITSDYYYDKNGIYGFTHLRKVNWTDKGKLPVKHRMAMKTLTDITSYKDYIKEFNNISNNPVNIINNTSDKELLINQLFTGRYLDMGDNIGHEITNIFKDDSGMFNLFITPHGKIENHNIDTILFVKNEDKPYVVEVVGIATNLQIFNADKDSLITYNGKTEKEIFYGNKGMQGNLETPSDLPPIMYRTKNIQMPVNRLYLGVKDLVNGDNIVLIDNNGKRLTNNSMRSYHKENSDIYKRLQEIINFTDWKPLDINEIYKRCSDNKIFEQQYTRFLNRINK